DLASVDAGAAAAKLAANHDLGDIVDANRHRAAGGDDDVSDLGAAFDATGGADYVAFAVALNVVGTAADIVCFDRLHDRLERQPVGGKPHRVRLDLELLDEAADSVGAGDPRHAAHLRSNDPVLNRAEIDRALKVVGQALAFRGEVRAVA